MTILRNPWQHCPMSPGAARLTESIIRSNTPDEQLHKTIRLIGQGIKAGSNYLPIRLHAANVATKAGRKDFMGQLKALFDDFLARWRYVKDPAHREMVAVSGPAIYGTIMGRLNSLTGLGSGDCDDATICLGALARTIGFTPRIVTQTMPGRRRPSHVYPEFFVGGRWIAADPVAYPRRPFGSSAPAAAEQRWNLDGQLQSSVRLNGPSNPEGSEMLGRLEDVSAEELQFADYGLENFGLCGTDGAEPEDMGNYIKGFGYLAGQYGILEPSVGVLAEVDTTADGFAQTPILEVGLNGWYGLAANNWQPYDGLFAYSDDGAVYQYQDTGLGAGFFKKIFKKGFKLLKKVHGFAKKIIKKLPGGKYLVKLGEKMHKLTMKMVKPLMKIVGPLAKKLAPVAALIPGYGPLIAAGLKTTGTIDELMNKHGVKQHPKTNKLIFKSGQQAKAFKQAMNQAAAAKRKAGGTKGPKKGLPGEGPDAPDAPDAPESTEGLGVIPKGSPAWVAKLRAMGIKVHHRGHAIERGAKGGHRVLCPYELPHNALPQWYRQGRHAWRMGHRGWIVGPTGRMVPPGPGMAPPHLPPAGRVPPQLPPPPAAARALPPRAPGRNW